MKIIAHLDLDAFFASVEEVAKSHLKGKPIAVGADPDDGRGRGVVSTANYKARGYGIKSAMPISQAWRLSEEARKQGKEPVVFLLGNHALYQKISQNVLEIIERNMQNYSFIRTNNGIVLTPLIEQASVDEFYFDLTATDSFESAKAICSNIKQEIFTSEKITCSIGLAPNKFIAKIAAGFKKPNGLYVVKPEEVQGFLDPLNIREFPGIGPKTAEIFYKKDIQNIKQLRQLSEQELKELVGKHGINIYHMARGIGSAEIITKHEVKSIGEQTTFMQNTLEATYIFNEFKKLSDSVFKTFLQSDFNTFKTITVTVRFSDFQTKNSSHTLATPISKEDKKKFEIESIKFLLPFLDKRQNPKRKLIRLIGVRIERLT